MTQQLEQLNMVLCQNADGSANSIHVCDVENNTVAFIASPSHPYSEKGWFKMLHEAILNTSFTLPRVITKDATHIVNKYHNIKKTDLKNYNKELYVEELFKYIVDEIVESEDTVNMIDKELDELIGHTDPIQYCEIRKVMGSSSHIPVNYASVTEFTQANNISGFTFYIHNMGNRQDYYAMCVYDVKKDVVYVTYKPNEFFSIMERGLYLFAGEINIKDKIEASSEIDSNMIQLVTEAVKNRINSFEK